MFIKPNSRNLVRDGVHRTINPERRHIQKSISFSPRQQIPMKLKLLTSFPISWFHAVPGLRFQPSQHVRGDLVARTADSYSLCGIILPVTALYAINESQRLAANCTAQHKAPQIWTSVFTSAFLLHGPSSTKSHAHITLIFSTSNVLWTSESGRFSARFIKHLTMSTDEIWFIKKDM